MRLLHLADLHVGKRINEFSLLNDQRYILAQALDVACARKVDALLIAGDIYDKAAPGNEAVACVDWLLAEASARGLTVLGVPGNHDSAERVAYAADLLARQGIHLPCVYDGRIAHVDLHDEHGAVRFWLVPFLNPAKVRHFFPDAQIADYTDALRVALDACVGELDPGTRNVAVAHQFVTCVGSQTERSDSELSLGGLDNVDAGVFDAFDYVALGHLHRPQRVGRDEVRYAGSPLKYSFSEIRGSKSMPLVELGPKGTPPSIELVPLVPLHDLREIRGPLAELTAPEVVAAASADDYLHVVLTDENPVADALARLRACYPNVMALDYDNARTRAAGALGAPGLGADDTRDPFDLFAAFYESQNGAPLTDGQARAVRAELERIEVL